MLHPKKHCDHIYHFTNALAKRYGVRLYRYANVGNHIHLLIKVPSRMIWQRFLRELSGGIAIIVASAPNCPLAGQAGAKLRVMECTLSIYLLLIVIF